MDKKTTPTKGGVPTPPVKVGSTDVTPVALRVRLQKDPQGQWTFVQDDHDHPIISIRKAQVVKVFSDEAPFRIQPTIHPEPPRKGAPPYPFEKLHDHVKAHNVHLLGPAVQEAHRPEDKDGGTTWKMTYELLNEDGTVREEWDPHIIVTP